MFSCHPALMVLMREDWGTFEGLTSSNSDSGSNVSISIKDVHS